MNGRFAYCMDGSPVPGQTREDRIRDLAQSVLPDASFFLLDVRIRGQKGVAQVDVVVDGDEGVSIAECAGISRRLQASLTVAGVFPDAFSLTVSSPGVDRPLTLPRQYRKNLGRPLSVVRRDAHGQEERVEGRLKDATDEDFILETQEGDRAVQYDDVLQARVQLPW